MSELTLFLIRFAYLAILWIFVLSAISVIRSDMFGARVPRRRATARPPARKGKASAKADEAAPRRADPPARHRGREHRRPAPSSPTHRC